jgi:hypothetical protein
MTMTLNDALTELFAVFPAKKERIQAYARQLRDYDGDTVFEAVQEVISHWRGSFAPPPAEIVAAAQRIKGAAKRDSVDKYPDQNLIPRHALAQVIPLATKIRKEEWRGVKMHKHWGLFSSWIVGYFSQTVAAHRLGLFQWFPDQTQYEWGQPYRILEGELIDAKKLDAEWRTPPA